MAQELCHTFRCPKAGFIVEMCIADGLLHPVEMVARKVSYCGYTYDVLYRGVTK